MKKVSPGDPLKIYAADWNKIVDTVNRTPQGVKSPTSRSGIGHGVIRVKNDTTDPFPVFTAVQITGHYPEPNYTTNGSTTASITNDPLDYYTATLPTTQGAAYAITQEPIPAGAIGKAMVYGITPARFIDSTVSPFAEPSVDEATLGQMVGAQTGSARVLAAPTSALWGMLMLGCGGGGSAETREYQPWDVIFHEGVLYMVVPEWTLDAPFPDEGYPEGADKPTPEFSRPLSDLVNPDFVVVINGVRCHYLSDLYLVFLDTNAMPYNFTHVYACMNDTGHWGIGIATAAVTQTPVCILIATLTRNQVGGVTAINQVRHGSLFSKWTEIGPYYVENLTSGEITRYSDPPIGRAEGTEMARRSFWKMATYISAGENQTLIAESENLSYGPLTFPSVQPALPYGSYVWRYEMFHSAAYNGITIATRTTPVLNVETAQYAKFVDVPFVDRIQVVYPESPLDQGSVSSVGGTVTILAPEIPVATTVDEIFKTESVDTVQGTLIAEV